MVVSKRRIVNDIALFILEINNLNIERTECSQYFILGVFLDDRLTRKSAIPQSKINNMLVNSATELKN